MDNLHGMKGAFLTLLDEAFPGIKRHILRCEELGFPWQSRPFFKEDRGEILAHIGFLECPFLIEGRWYTAGALHAICTKASHRGQGVASQLIQEVLLWAKERYDFLLLFTKIPKFYEKCSFQSVAEHRFHLRYRQDRGTQELFPMISPRDRALFLRVFREREPLSNKVWLQDTGAIASLNTLYATYPCHWSLHYSPSLDACISFELEGKTLHLFDVVARRIPSLEEICSHLPSAIEEIYFYFSPDRLTKQATIEPYSLDGDVLMVHGNWPKTAPFMISPLSRC